jgi:NTE family protein
MKQYTGLVLSAGAAGGYYHLGALHALWTETKDLEDLRYFSGASVGAAIAMLLAVGYTPVELFATLCTKDVNKLFEFEVSNLSTKWGFIDNKKFYEYLECLVLDKMHYVPTFSQLLQETKKTLVIPSWCVTDPERKHKVYFSPKTHPDMNIIDAVMCSCNIPILFTKAEVQDNLWVDGGLFDKCPANFLKQYMAEAEEENFHILVLNLVWSKSRKEAPKTLMQYIKSICYITLRVQQSPVSDECLDVFPIESELSDMSLQVDLKHRIDIFTATYNSFRAKIKSGKDVVQPNQ